MSARRSITRILKPLVAVLGLIWSSPTTAVGASISGSISQRDTSQRRLRHDPDESNEQGDAGTCRVAVCLSGAIRSFVHHAVHGSIQGNLIEAIKADGCKVDVFAYATREDTVGRDKKVSNSEFTPNASDIRTVLEELAPTRLVWHQEQAGSIPNSCPADFDSSTAPSPGGGRYGGDDGVWTSSTWQIFRPDASNDLYWQMYKSLAVYRMALREEKRKGRDFAYDWIIRGRFDVAWVRPLPPLRSFSREAVWFGRHYWPMSDQFAMVPRAFSDRFFNAVAAFYACDGQSWPPSVAWWQPGCRCGFEESVLFRHLHASDVPYRYYFMFQYKITRGALGGACHLAQVAFDEPCNLLTVAGAFGSPLNSQQCSEALAEWATLRCQTLLPAKGMNDARRTDAMLSSDPRAWEQLVDKLSSEQQTPAAAATARTGRETSGTKGGPFTIGETLRYTAVPTTKDIDRVRSKLIALRDAVLLPTVHPSMEDAASVFDNFEAKNYSRSDRWDGWQMLPLWSVYSLTGCPLEEPRFPGLSPHIVSYYTMRASLLRELAQSLKCFVHGLIQQKSDEVGDDFDRSSCEGTRSLEMIMIDVALHTEELGICTADDGLGLRAMDHILSFFREPAVHCKGYGNLGDDHTA